MQTAIDLNCDLGEGAGNDAALMRVVSSANIACGAHAGDEATMRATIALAQKFHVAIGAHPGFADRDHFGRRERVISPPAAGDLVCAQIQTLQRIAVSMSAVVRHVKLHGALYNMAARDLALAEAVAEGIGRAVKNPILFVLAGSVLEQVARKNGDFQVVSEVFADRSYQNDGSLTPRSQPDAMIRAPDLAAAQVLRMVREGVVRATDGTEVPIKADTVCIHGDGPQAVAFARRLKTDLKQAGIAIKAVSA